MKVAVVTCHFNPAGWENRVRCYQRFRNSFTREVPVHIVELCFGDRPEINCPDLLFFGGEEHKLWQKEALLNILIRDLVDEYDAIAWVDADIVFFDRNWVKELKLALEAYDVVQLFTKIKYENARGVFKAFPKASCGSGYPNCGDLNRFHPGFAWAARSEWLKKGLLYDKCIAGSGDTCIVQALLKKDMLHLSKYMTPVQLDHFTEYRTAMYTDKVTAISGTIGHFYHGELIDRGYTNRWKMCEPFNPYTHVVNNDDGFLEWTNLAPAELKKSILEYFYSRKEDQ